MTWCCLVILKPSTYSIPDVTLMNEGVDAQGNVTEFPPACGVAVQLWCPLRMHLELELVQ